jgi:hypothetical protein
MIKCKTKLQRNAYCIQGNDVCNHIVFLRDRVPGTQWCNVFITSVVFGPGECGTTLQTYRKNSREEFRGWFRKYRGWQWEEEAR